MRALRPILFAAVLLAPLALASTPSVHERNVGYLRALVGDDDLAQPATTHDGRVVTLAQAIEEAAARAGQRSLALQGLAPLADDAFWGDVWVLDLGPGPCAVQVLGPGSPETYALHASFYVYEGETSEMGGPSDELVVINWNNAAAGYYAPGHWRGVGNTDWWCVETATGHFAFPFLNGVVTAGPDDGAR